MVAAGAKFSMGSSRREKRNPTGNGCSIDAGNGARLEAGLQAVISDGKGELGYALGIARQVVRTTSLLERTNRALRRKFRQACCFSSYRGALVAIYLQVPRLHVRWTKTSWAHTARSLSLAFY